MRDSQPALLENKNGVPCALMLEASYCGEQERGISPILDVLGIPAFPSVLDQGYDGPWGLERSIATVPLTGENCAFVSEDETKATLARAFLSHDLPWE